MLMRTEPFQDLERLTRQLLGSEASWSRPAMLPMDAYRSAEEVVLMFDLPGLDPDAIDVNVERNVLTVRAERRPTAPDGVERQFSERPLGVFSRQLSLGDNLDADHIQATYDAGVLTLRIPVTAEAKPRKIEISAEPDHRLTADPGQKEGLT
jgi:HSP20 family protein